MSLIPDDLRYTKSHEWVRMEDDGTVTIGITDHAQALLGDLVFIEVPEAGNTYTEGDDCAIVESVKAASDVYCPLDGEVIAGNEVLADAPETVNKDAFGDGWMFKLSLTDAGSFESLMDAEAYKEIVAEDEH